MRESDWASAWPKRRRAHDADALEKRVAQDAAMTSCASQIANPGVELPRRRQAGGNRRLANPSIIAMNVFSVNPSTRCGVLAST
jgi:phage terminase large subunit-like protein